jgi:formylglycine-generating enzyme required for sulfatase activity
MTRDPIQTMKIESSNHVSRGGSSYNDAENLVVSLRNYDAPGDRYYDLGFRPVRNVSEKVCYEGPDSN